MSEFIKKDNTREVLSDLDNKIQDALALCGKVIESKAKSTAHVDTGRYKNSFTYVVGSDGAGTHNYSDNNGKQYSEEINEGDKTKCIAGTNVEYAPHLERLYKTLSNAFLSNTSRFKRIITRVLKS